MSEDKSEKEFLCLSYFFISSFFNIIIISIPFNKTLRDTKHTEVVISLSNIDLVQNYSSAARK